MLVVVQIASVVLTAITLSLALAHALEMPGKLRLGKEAYAEMQAVYYPGFTIAGVSEPLAIVEALALVSNNPKLWRILLVGAYRLHGADPHARGLLGGTHPVNKFWLKDQRMTGFAAEFFSVGQAQGGRWRCVAEIPRQMGILPCIARRIGGYCLGIPNHRDCNLGRRHHRDFHDELRIGQT